MSRLMTQALCDLMMANFVGAGDNVLDMSVGCGDQTLHLARSHSFTSYIGISFESGQFQLARSRCSQLPNTRIVRADAVAFLMSMPRESVDSILCLDAIYHFNTRESALRSAFKVLRPSGKLRLTDLVVSNGMMGNFSTRAMLYLCSLVTDIPWVNWVHEEEYLSNFREIGYSDIQVEDISDHVFSGLADHVRRMNRRFDSGWIYDWDSGAAGSASKPKGWSKYGMFLPALFGHLARSKVLKFIVIRATKTTK